MEDQSTPNFSDSFNQEPTNLPPALPEKRTSLVGPILLTAFICAILFGFLGFYLGKQSLKSPEIEDNVEVSATPIPSLAPSPSDTTSWNTETIPDINLTFSVPQEMNVKYETQTNAETGVPYSLTLYIERDMGELNYYQLYGIYQWDIQQDSLDAYKADLEPSSVKDLSISGYPALEGQVKGQRNRFVTYIQTDTGIFSLYTAEPTEENKQITDKILATFEFTN